MISSLLPEHHRQGREHALVFSVEASLNFLSRPYAAGRYDASNSGGWHGQGGICFPWGRIGSDPSSKGIDQHSDAECCGWLQAFRESL
jgi:hypothetical protein